MKLLRVGPRGEESPAVMTEDGRLLDLSPITADIDGVFLADGLTLASAAIASGDLPSLDGDGMRIGAPLARPGKVVCIGLNYRAHAEESDAAPPSEPVVFLKTPYTVIGPNDTVLIPRGSTKTDYEIELGVVIGRTARYLDTAEDGLACVGGYAVSHDVSEREFQLERGGTWDKGKNCETFNPLGPWLVTADEVPDPQALDLRLWVNGNIRQNGSTKDMIFQVGEIIHYLSQFMVLEPGDIINTGTPAGVALGHPDPKPYLRPGDVVELEISGLGRQRQAMGQA
ncbi:fumarylacetoacetate hydrolase family protein [Micromonospora sp. NPDC007230]|uniref:fumarylacetoacetate hydrolase family protein n=1 Tax=Micromonospora sp. NPDC007230 TaxID=3364237 RepID=UPI0036BB1115